MNKEEMKKLISSIDIKDYYETEVLEDITFKKTINGLIESNIKFETKSILGIDIYQYSQYESNRQTLIPFIFDLIYDEAIEWCKKDELVFFHDYDFEGKFINTGDGGFQIFDEPIQALIFNINFNTILRLFNSGHFYPKLRTYIKEIVLRTCITLGKIYKYNNNYFGEGIISNARILSNVNFQETDPHIIAKLTP